MNQDGSAQENLVQEIVQYVVDLRGQGHFLPYEDYAIIEGWISSSTNQDDLLLVIGEVLPDFFSELPEGAKPKSLASVNKKILKALKLKTMLK